MNKILYKILIEPTTMSFIDRIINFFTKKFRYTFWIEYRIHEDRFWYCQQLGKLYSEHHTKNDKINSLNIIKDIAKRASLFDYKVTILVDKVSYYDNCYFTLYDNTEPIEEDSTGIDNDIIDNIIEQGYTKLRG